MIKFTSVLTVAICRSSCLVRIRIASRSAAAAVGRSPISAHCRLGRLLRDCPSMACECPQVSWCESLASRYFRSRSSLGGFMRVGDRVADHDCGIRILPRLHAPRLAVAPSTANHVHHAMAMGCCFASASQAIHREDLTSRCSRRLAGLFAPLS